MIEKETGILCFECRKRSGIDCPGRKPYEATRCVDCLEKFMQDEEMRQSLHLLEKSMEDIKAGRTKDFRQAIIEIARNLGLKIDAE